MLSDMAIDPATAILQVLISGEAFGIEIGKRIEERTKGKLSFPQGTIYPLLRKLEREGLLKSREGEPLPERGGRPKIFYKLTAKGAAAAMENREIVTGLFPNPVRAS
jgi:PadR family transcriptional regulator PadR